MPEGARAGLHTFWHARGLEGKPVLFIHCSLGHCGAWAEVIAALGGGLRTLAFDLPGHGGSAEPPETADIYDLSTAIAAEFAEQMGAGAPVHLVGHSFGGAVALRLATERPGLVASLTLLEPTLFAAARLAGRREFDDHIADIQPFVAEIGAGRAEAAAAAFLEIWGTGLGWISLPAAQRRYIIDRIGLGVRTERALFGDSAGLLAPGRLEQVRVPVTLVEGGRTQPVIGAINDALAGRLPNARRVRIEGATHMAPLTHPRAVAEAIAGTLSRG